MLLCLFVVLLSGCTATALPLDENFEIANGDIVEDPAELPFLCRMHLRGWRKSFFCGAALISPDFLVTAKHCVKDFYDLCEVVEHCYVACRDLNRAGFDVGQFRVSIYDVFVKPGKSDLAVIQLKEKVHKHKDYDKGVPIVPVTLATEAPEPGDEVMTAGWGQTDFREGFSEQLRRLQLKVTSVEKLVVKTAVTNKDGEVADPCEGDSGGPLLIRRQNNWEVVGTLQVWMDMVQLRIYCANTIRCFDFQILARVGVSTATTTKHLEMENGTTWLHKSIGSGSR